jgi:hypothetical protein
MATTEDELAKKRVQEAVWTWTGRLVVLAVTFGFGFFAAFLLWGAGQEGAPALRAYRDKVDAQLLECKNKQVDLEGQLTVYKGRLDQAYADLAKARAAASGAPATP